MKGLNTVRARVSKYPYEVHWVKALMGCSRVLKMTAWGQQHSSVTPQAASTILLTSDIRLQLRIYCSTYIALFLCFETSRDERGFAMLMYLKNIRVHLQ